MPRGIVAIRIVFYSKSISTDFVMAQIFRKFRPPKPNRVKVITHGDMSDCQRYWSELFRNDAEIFIKNLRQKMVKILFCS